MTTIRVPCRNVRRHGGAHAVGEDGGLVGGRRGLALGDRLGLDDFQRHALRQLDGNRSDVVQRQLDRHVLLQIRRGVADDILGHLDLVVGLGVHEVEAVSVFIEVVEIVILDGRLLHLVGGLVALGNL